jgi:hypothetical protein
MAAGSSSSKSGTRRWPLVALTKIDPSKLIGPNTNNPVDSFFLALALCFNDLKTLVLVLEWLGQPPNSVPADSDRGQWAGIFLHVYRYAAGLLHELLKLIKEKEAVLESAQFKRVLSLCSLQCRSNWGELVLLASDKGTKARTLARIRNTAAFHYYDPSDLVRGFRRHFFENEPSPHNRAAFVSLGTKMDDSRLYFADAAVEQALALASPTRDLADAKELVEELIKVANLALFPLVRASIQEKGGLPRKRITVRPGAWRPRKRGR